MNDATRRLLPTISANAGPAVQGQAWSVQAFRSPEANAYSFPDGHIFLSTGLLNLVRARAKDPGGLESCAVCFLVAHEMAHLVLRHHGERLRTERLLAQGLSLAPQALVELLQVPFTRDLETEADRYAFLYCVQSGLDPEQVLAFVGDLARQVPAGSRSHPAMADRAAALREDYGLRILPALNNWRRGMRDRATGDFKAAAMWFRRVEQTFPSSPAVPYNLACALLEEACGGSTWRRDHPVLLPLAVASLAGSRGGGGPLLKDPRCTALVEEARGAFERSLQRNPRYVSAREGSAMCDFLAGDADRALHGLKSLPRRRGGEASALTLEGILLHEAWLDKGSSGREARTVEAERLYLEALSQDSSYWPARFNLALLLDLVDPTRAQAQWKALSSMQEVPDPWARYAAEKAPARSRGVQLEPGPDELIALPEGNQAAVPAPPEWEPVPPSPSPILVAEFEGLHLQPGSRLDLPAWEEVQLEPGVFLLENRLELEATPEGTLTRVVLPEGSPIPLAPLAATAPPDRYLELLGPPTRRFQDGTSEWWVWSARGAAIRVAEDIVTERMLFAPRGPGLSP